MLAGASGCGRGAPFGTFMLAVQCSWQEAGPLLRGPASWPPAWPSLLPGHAVLVPARCRGSNGHS
eukprot:10633506-Lingulodinium_polyedra.AAC.1